MKKRKCLWIYPRYIDDLYDENNNEINQCAAQLMRVYEE